MCTGVDNSFAGLAQKIWDNTCLFLEQAVVKIVSVAGMCLKYQHHIDSKSNELLVLATGLARTWKNFKASRRFKCCIWCFISMLLQCFTWAACGGTHVETAVVRFSCYQEEVRTPTAWACSATNIHEKTIHFFWGIAWEDTSFCLRNCMHVAEPTFVTCC